MWPATWMWAMATWKVNICIEKDDLLVIFIILSQGNFKKLREKERSNHSAPSPSRASQGKLGPKK